VVLFHCSGLWQREALAHDLFLRGLSLPGGLFFEAPKFYLACIASEEAIASGLLQPQNLRHHVGNVLIGHVVELLVVGLELRNVGEGLLLLLEDDASTTVVTNHEQVAPSAEAHR